MIISIMISTKLGMVIRSDDDNVIDFLFIMSPVDKVSIKRKHLSRKKGTKNYGKDSKKRMPFNLSLTFRAVSGGNLFLFLSNFLSSEKSRSTIIIFIFFFSPACSANLLLKLHILSANATSHPYFKLLWTGKSLVPCAFFFIISSLPLIGYLVAARTSKQVTEGQNQNMISSVIYVKQTVE
jgi:hypothetical protein